jgi:hypothetical protein
MLSGLRKTLGEILAVRIGYFSLSKSDGMTLDDWVISSPE